MTQEEFNQLMQSKEEIKVILYTDSSAVGLCYKFDTFGELVDLIENQAWQKSAEWSEEDEDHVNSLLKRLKGLCRKEFTTTRFAINEDEDWLKSLKERIGE